MLPFSGGWRILSGRRWFLLERVLDMEKVVIDVDKMQMLMIPRVPWVYDETKQLEVSVYMVPFTGIWCVVVQDGDGKTAFF